MTVLTLYVKIMVYLFKLHRNTSWSSTCTVITADCDILYETSLHSGVLMYKGLISRGQIAI